ncbi:hypothetical protein C5167_008622 [Papaver somniferum]|uniref:Uncharacterized protein n=1 Tax=Papaver somniferum TaxID=3469 RepID=A0A4Y7JV27_PAPSO|nr:hypothetical protein C5167_008622 [Papaver somniferum]
MTLPVKFMNQHRNKRNLTFGLIAGFKHATVDYNIEPERC